MIKTNNIGLCRWVGMISLNLKLDEGLCLFGIKSCGYKGVVCFLSVNRYGQILGIGDSERIFRHFIFVHLRPYELKNCWQISF